ncbi:hypothetical protein DUD61_004464 [Geotrichum candidum]|nr:hypothetical protein DUD61_004464 [Geotrichum candidum]
MSSAAVETSRGGDLTRDYNHSVDPEYKRLRDLAQREYELRLEAVAQSKEAYNSGDGAEAKRLSEKGKQHGAKMDEYNAQAAQFVFRENNADSAGDEIDLHGLYVKGKSATTRADSLNHIAKLKPAVVEFCEKNNLPHHTQDGNAGVIIVDLSQASGYQGQPNMEYTPQQGHQNHNNQQQHQSQQQDSNDDCVNLFVNVLTFCFKKFFK